MTENTAKFARGSMIKEKFYDIIKRTPKQTDSRSGEEIVMDIVNRAGLELA